MSHNLRLLRNSRGDTIVEVLISIVILALVLSGAYHTANASLNNVTDAQERTQALDVAQNQVEDLRANASLAAFAPYTVLNKVFCFDSTNTATTYDPLENPITGPCVIQSRYTVKITTTATPSAPSNPSSTNVGSYQVLVSWPAINNSGNNQLVLFYRVAT
jgi:Tfp pilus assembly protein PilV